MSGTNHNLPAFFTSEYEGNFSNEWRQRFSKWRSKVTVRKGGGERFSTNELADIGSAQEITDRLGSQTLEELTGKKRFANYSKWEKALGIDKWDEILLGEIALPKSEAMEQQMGSLNQKIDQIVYAAATGSVTEDDGSGGTQTVAFDTSNQQVAVNYIQPGGTPANVGLTTDKIVNALGKIKTSLKGEPLTEPVYLFATQHDIDTLLQTDSQIASLDTNARRALMDADIPFWAGVNIMYSPSVTVDSATDFANCVMWVPSAIHLGFGQEPQVKADVLPTKRYALQLYADAMVAAVRKKDPGVISILTDQSP